MALTLGAGDFRKKVIIRKYGRVQNEQGGWEGNGVLLTHVTFAAEASDSQQRAREAQNPELVNTKVIYLRYLSAPDGIGTSELRDWKLEIDGKEYNLFSEPVLRDSGMKVFEIACKAK